MESQNEPMQICEVCSASSLVGTITSPGMKIYFLKYIYTQHHAETKEFYTNFSSSFFLLTKHLARILLEFVSTERR